MTITLIICGTVIICLFLILKWAHDMSTAELPMFTYAECVKKEASDDAPVNTPIGFAAPEEKPNEKTKKELKDAYLTDPITLTASLLRGEVDIDDIST